MTTQQLRSLAMAAMLPCIQGIQPAYAQLPMMKEHPWIGYFAVAEDRAFQLLLVTDGTLTIKALNKDGRVIEPPIALKFLAMETLPDGSVRELAMKPNAIESSDPPTAKLKKTVFQCKLTDQATGQPTLEGTIEITNGTILARARIIDKGAFTNHPLRPVIRVVFPSFYVAENSAKAQWDRKKSKDFERQIAKDTVTLQHLDGKRVKLDCVEGTDAKSKEVNGLGSSSAEIRISAYQKRRIELLADPNSSITLGNTSTASLHNGFWLQWSPDAAKDPNGAAKLAISIK